MKLDQFSLEKETPTEMHVKHPSGKVLVLNKAAMSDKAKSMVKKMACGGAVGYDEGGDVDSSDGSIYGAQDVDAKIEKDKHPQATQQGNDNTSDSIDVRTPEQKARSQQAATTYGYADGGQVGQNTVLAPQDPAIENAMQINLPTPAPQAPQVAVQAPNPISQDPMIQSKLSQEDLLNKEERDVSDLSKAQQGASGNVQAAYDDYADSMDDTVKNPNDMVADMEAKDKTLAQAFMQNKIDPDRYWNSKSTLGKLSAGIAMGLGGIAAGVNGGSNLVMDQFNKAVNNDIDAQKSEQGKSMSLWKMNREAFGDDMRANLATQNQLYTGLQAKLAKAAAQVQAPEAKFHASQLLDQIEQQKIANRQRLGLLTQGQTGAGGAGNLSSADPLNLATDPNVVPADRQKDVISEIGKAQYVNQNAKDLLSLYDKADKENTIAGRAGRLGYEPPSMKSLRLLAVPLLKDNDGRVNEAALSSFNEILPGPGEREGTGQAKRAAFENFIRMHQEAPTAKAYGIDPQRFKSTSSSPQASMSPQESQYYNWAKANPSDPRAKAVMQKLGAN